MDRETETHESILNEGERVVGDFGNELNSLTLGRMVDASLEDATSVTVSSDFDTVRRDGVVDELVVLWGKVVEALLDHVVTVEIYERWAMRVRLKDTRVRGRKEDEPLMRVTTLRFKAKIRL